ncbi:MAG: hypothetical protein NZ853_00355 [Leptospiraceae bacterium]|nr:hypothetical protein [Leptospiraceae bacterium]MDW7976321.1 hypothetical protein [Leptospiraceae bacterium]
MKHRIIIFSILLLTLIKNIEAIGTYAEGRAIVKVIQLISKGIFVESYEGVFEIASYNEDEECSDFQNCYTPQIEKVEFSIRIENKETIKFIQENLNKVILIDYKIHRIEPIALGTNFEVLKAYPFKLNLPIDFPEKFIVTKSGVENYSFFGKVLQLEYRGTAIKSYEGIYYDRQRDKIRPFSLTNEDMANFIKTAMEYTKEYHIGVSKALIAGLRETKFDIFEINYVRPAGGVE